jgi:hypothetical protein
VFEAFDADIDLDGLSNGQLCEWMLAFDAARQRFEAAHLRLARRWDARRAWAGDGALSGTGWLRNGTGQSSRRARALLRVASAVSSMQATEAAFEAEAITLDHVELLCRTRTEANAEVFDRDEALLVKAASEFDADQFAKVLRYWKACADAEGFGSDAEARHAARQASVSETLDGMVHINAVLDPEGGRLFKAIFDAIDTEFLRADGRDHELNQIAPRTNPQRRADALVDLARRAGYDVEWTDTDTWDQHGDSDGEAQNDGDTQVHSDREDDRDTQGDRDTEGDRDTQGDNDTQGDGGDGDTWARAGSDHGETAGDTGGEICGGAHDEDRDDSGPDGEGDRGTRAYTGPARQPPAADTDTYTGIGSRSRSRPRHRTRSKVRPGRGARPAVMIIANLETLTADSGGVAHLDNGVAITGDAARRLACDAGICRVLTNGRSEPLDLGRKTATYSPAQWRFVAIRDGGCAFAGCDQPVHRCDLHHVIYFARGSSEGGTTSVHNGAMLCPRHHHLVHEGGFTLTRNPITGQIDTRRPDGTLLRTRPRSTPLDPTARHNLFHHETDDAA